MILFTSDSDALSFLRARGYREVRNGFLAHRDPDHRPAADETAAIRYLIEEWDFAGLTPQEPDQN